MNRTVGGPEPHFPVTLPLPWGTLKLQGEMGESGMLRPHMDIKSLRKVAWTLKGLRVDEE
jgi:hypothetical protein